MTLSIQTAPQFGGAELDRIARYAKRQSFARGEPVFSEGEPADRVYFIESGSVSIFTQNFALREDIAVLGAGECFGEMAMTMSYRTASAAALSDTVVLSIETDELRRLVQADAKIAAALDDVIAHRHDEIEWREKLFDRVTINGRHFRVSIKGDPSLRESAFARERFESVVDRLLPGLQPRVEELLTRRCVYKVFMHFNSGEVHTYSVLDPFNGAIHPANKLMDEAYLDRHFARMTFECKTALIRHLYHTVAGAPCVAALPDHLQRRANDQARNWQPMSEDEVRTALSRLDSLRGTPNFYIRNFEITITREALRMQFNCDGTHIVSARDYLNFVQEYIVD